MWHHYSIKSLRWRTSMNSVLDNYSNYQHADFSNNISVPVFVSCGTVQKLQSPASTLSAHMNYGLVVARSGNNILRVRCWLWTIRIIGQLWKSHFQIMIRENICPFYFQKLKLLLSHTIVLVLALHLKKCILWMQPILLRYLTVIQLQ